MPLLGSFRHGGGGTATGSRKSRRLGSSSLFGTKTTTTTAAPDEDVPLSSSACVHGPGYGGTLAATGAASSSDTETVTTTTTTADDWTIGSLSPVRLIQQQPTNRRRLYERPESAPAEIAPPPKYSQLVNHQPIRTSMRQREKQLQFSDTERSHVFYEDDDVDDGEEADNKRKRW